MHSYGSGLTKELVNSKIQASFKVFAAVWVRRPFFWVATLRHWFIFPEVSRQGNGLNFKAYEVHTEIFFSDL